MRLSLLGRGKGSHGVISDLAVEGENLGEKVVLSLRFSSYVLQFKGFCFADSPEKIYMDN